MMQVYWTPVAQSNFDDQIDFIAAYNEKSAARFKRLVYEHTLLLETMPHLGKAGRVEGTRELVIARTPFIVVYHVSSNLVAIVRLLHGAQEYPM